ncbi:YtxH domain-containing protein [Nocardiopsis changdeensis]|uniref:DUF3618 domain-containing protein n=1 Tax=Nocardiopsis changdeensis TaxID=2831969 RepID=A0ABX8BMQ4_9ACTN|nr:MULTISPECIES: YtxH domain-containing protein [Nocardiopsis]QKW31612.1 hypothetical protein HUT17_00440 [Nocardiopsis flavescens]QUX22863.1 hypothetical protein KGD84_00060 [Nocardiopsis changdeensis]QYX38805.1 hypothetical protein K1J57_09510 [Nocardiopsis sp. MT53]
MPITAKRRKARKEAEVAITRLQDLAREQADRFGPYADQAREQAARTLLQARGWTAPRLETAASRVEDTVAPRVAGLLTAAAQRVDPRPARRGLRGLRNGGRRVPRAVLIGGAALVGGVIVYSLVRMRQASQDAEWQEHLDQAREQVRETREDLEDKAGKAAEKAGEKAGTAARKAKDAKEAVKAAAGDRSKENGRSGS